MFIYILFLLGFLVLVKGADLLVDGATSIANKLKISNLVIGLTIVAFGTSAPEMFINITASLRDSSGIAIGNILGSNIANILLILGVSAMIYPLAVQRTTITKEIPLSLLAALVLGILLNDQLIDHNALSVLSRSDGLILIAFFVIFMYYIFSIAKKADVKKNDGFKELSNFKSALYLLLGMLGLVIGGTWIINGAVKIANQFGVSEYLIGLTVIALGTSLPELATSTVAAYKKNADIAIGNVIGSSIFNIFWVLGISSIIKPLPFNKAGNSDVFMVIVANLLLLVFLFIGKKRVLQKWQGILFLTLYIGYMVFLILKG